MVDEIVATTPKSTAEELASKQPAELSNEELLNEVHRLNVAQLSSATQQGDQVKRPH